MLPSFERTPKVEKVPGNIQEFSELEMEGYNPDDLLGDVRDILDSDFVRLYVQLPKELWVKQTQKLQSFIENHKANGRNVTRAMLLAELAHIVESREHVTTEFNISDPALREQLGNNAERVLREAVTHIFEDNSSAAFLNTGQTAQVKRLRLSGGTNEYAIKFLLTPTAKTLSASAEHDMLTEAERMQLIEGYERAAGVGHFFRTPHPYFAYKDSKMQSYAMESIDGMNIHELFDSAPDDELTQQIRESFMSRRDAKSDEVFTREMRAFIDIIHKVCIHGDIKPKNLMVDKNGHIYLIDFGQSVSVLDATEKTGAQFDRLKELERDQLRTLIKHLENFVFRGTVPQSYKK